MRLEQNRSGNGASILDLHAQAGSDFDLRFIRAAGPNGDGSVINAGTGALIFSQNSTERFRADANGLNLAAGNPRGFFGFGERCCISGLNLGGLAALAEEILDHPPSSAKDRLAAATDTATGTTSVTSTSPRRNGLNG